MHHRSTHEKISNDKFAVEMKNKERHCLVFFNKKKKRLADEVSFLMSYMLHIRSLFIYIRSISAVSFCLLFTNRKLQC